MYKSKFEYMLTYPDFVIEVDIIYYRYFDL